MIFQSGKHEGKSGETVVLKSPDWVQALLTTHPDNKWCAEFKRLIAKFDAKPFTATCSGCNAPATRATAYKNTSNLMFWCATCNPYGSGAVPGTLTPIQTYADALRHVDQTCTAPRTEKRDIIRALAQGKGLPKKVGKPQALAFFK